MSDHIDGPRSIGDPSIDMTDLFCFMSPENPARTVFAADVFPSAGASAVFSDAANHAIVARRVTVAGLGDAAKFQAGDREMRFNFRFDRLESRLGQTPIQRCTCTLPDGQTLRLVVNDEKGAPHAGWDGSRLRRTSLRSVPAGVAGGEPQALPQPAGARQRAVLPGRLRHEACARPCPGLVVRCHRRDDPGTAGLRHSSATRRCASTGWAAPSRPTFV